MTIGTLVRYLLGRRDAVLTIAATPSSIWPALIFVLSAGFAREYDGADLAREPWQVVLPLAVSWATSTLLYLLLALLVWYPHVPLRPAVYRSFVSLYWLMAPMAWLYAIPVERFLSPLAAAQANFAFLGIVSVWRVLLVTRVISVLFNCRFLAALFPVLLFADVVAFIATFVSPRPIWNVMGGVRLTEEEAFILNATCSTQILGVLTFPIWLIGTIVMAFRAKPKSATWPASTARSVSGGLWALAALAVGVWPLVLPYTQPRQRNARHADELLQSGQIAPALEFMSRHVPDDFPPHWDPPPRIAYGDDFTHLLRVVEETAATDCAGWVRDLYTQKYTRQFGAGLATPRWMADDLLVRHVALLRQSPLGPELARRVADDVQAELDSASTGASEQRLALLRELLTLAGELTN
jgi:hypothetical protein